MLIYTTCTLSETGRKTRTHGTMMRFEMNQHTVFLFRIDTTPFRSTELASVREIFRGSPQSFSIAEFTLNKVYILQSVVITSIWRYIILIYYIYYEFIYVSILNQSYILCITITIQLLCKNDLHCISRRERYQAYPQIT